MATRNEQAVTDTADTLLRQIKMSAENSTQPQHLHELAEAFALVAGSDPKNPPPAPMAVGR